MRRERRLLQRYRAAAPMVNRHPPCLLASAAHEEAGVDAVCSAISRETGESLAGTAPFARGWVLIEQPGSWSAKTLDNLPESLAARLVEASADGSIRVQLIRRSGARAGQGVRRVFLVHAGDTTWIEQLDVADGAWGDVAFAAAADATPPGAGARVDDGLILVCTHGARDRCCAQLGRPIVDALVGEHGERVWETSHVGGHRFTGNVVLLPSGLAYGGLDAAAALDAVARHERGELALAHLRGRCMLEPAQQAAEVLLRAAHGLDHDGGPPVVTPGVDGSMEVALAGQAWRVRVTHAPRELAVPLSCGDVPEDPGMMVLSQVSRLG